MSYKHCAECGELFKAGHGNIKYCYKNNCSKTAKLKRQKENYLIGDDAKKAIQRNHEIFTSLLGKNATGEF